MNLNEFDRLTVSILLPVLREVGFECDRGTFSRNLPRGVRQVLVVDFDVRSKATFRVIVGFNHDAVAGSASPAEAGVYGARYLDRNGFSSHPSNFPCFAARAAEQSLVLVRRLLESDVLPWFDDHRDVMSVVESMEPYYAFVKGRILLSDGRYSDAKRYLQEHLRQLEQKNPADAVLAGIEETKTMIHDIPEV